MLIKKDKDVYQKPSDVFTYLSKKDFRPSRRKQLP